MCILVMIKLMVIFLIYQYMYEGSRIQFYNFLILLCKIAVPKN